MTMRPAARARGEEGGRKNGSTAERARLKAIFGSEVTMGRDELAKVLAFETNMTAEAAIALLSKSPKVVSVPKTSRLEGRVPQPRVAAFADAPTEASGTWTGVVADLNKAYARDSGRSTQDITRGE